MNRFFALLPAFLLAALSLNAQTVTVSGTHVTDSGGNPIYGTIYFQPVQSFRLSGGGTVTTTPVQATLSNGAFSVTLADTTQGSPQNVCYNVWATNTGGTVVFGSPSKTLATGYQCVQMSTTWCANGICNLDSYVPQYPSTAAIETKGVQLDGSVSGSVTLLPPSTVSTYTAKLPNAQGVGCLYDDGNGNLSWSACGGSGGGGGSGTVTNFSVASTPAWMSFSVSNPSTTPALTLSAATGQTSHQVIGTCGASTIFGPCSLTGADLPAINLAAAGNGGVTGQLPYSSVSGTPSSLPPSGSASGDLSDTYPGPTVAKINGTSVPTNAASDQALITNAIATGLWASLPTCLDSGGQHLNYNTTTHAFSCGTTGGTPGSVAFNTLTGGTNTQASMVVGSGASLTVSGTGTNNANQVNGATIPTSANLVGTNASGQIVSNTTSYLTGNQTVTLSGDTSGSGATAITTTTSKVNGVSYPAAPSTNTLPVVTSANTITYETVPNSALQNAATTVNGTVCTLGASCTISVSGTTFQTNGTNLTSSSTVNFQNSSATNGLTLTFANPSAGNVQLGLSGTLNNSGLTNAATTVNGQTCTLGATCSFGSSSLSNGSNIVLNNQANTYSSGLQDLSAATLKVPAAAGYAPTTANLLGLNSTTGTIVWGNGTQTNKAAWWAGTAPTSGNCVEWGANGQLTDVGSACGTSSGGTGTVTNFSVTSVPSWLTSSVANATTTPALTIGLAAAQTANQFLATPNGASGTVGLRSIVAADIPTLNQNTTGNAATATSATTATNLAGGSAGSLPYQSGAGATSLLAGNTAATDQVVVSHGTGTVAQAPTLSNAPALSAANMTSFPTLNQNTTGNAATATSATTATNLAGGSTGAIPYQSGSGATSLLTGNTAATDQVLVSHGTGAAAQAPSLTNAPALSAANMTSFPTLNQNTTGNAATATSASQVNGVSYPAAPSTNTVPVVTAANTTTYETVPVAAGGTNLASGTSGGVLYFSGSTTLASSGALTANKPVIGGGAGVAPSSGTTSGNTTTFATTTGTLISGHCVQFDASGNLVDSGSTNCGGGGSTAWSAIGNPAGNLSLSMGSDTSTFTFGATTGTGDLFKWTDTLNNTGTGALGHFTTASGSAAIPFEADANGVGWEVNASGQLASVGQTSSGTMTFNGSTSGSAQITVAAAAGTPNPLQLPTASATANYGLISSGGNPQVLSWASLSGTGNCSSNSWVSGLNTDAAPTCSQPASTNLSDSSNLVRNNAGNTYTAGAQSFASATSLTVPSAAGAAPTSDGQIAENTTNHTHVWGLNGTTTLVGAVAATGTGTATTCTNQAVTAVSGIAAPTCSTITSAYTDTSIAKTGTDINASNQVTATHLAAALPVNQGGTGTTSTLTGLVRGSASAMTAAELSGDATTSGSNAVTVVKVNGGAVPVSAAVLSSNSSSQLTAATTTGSGSVVLATTPSLSNPSLGTTAATISVSNAGTTGTTVNTLAKLTGAPSTAVITATSDTSGAIGVVVSGAGTAGSAQIARSGEASCVFDAGTTAGDYVQISSTTAGNCHDAGSSYPTSGQVIGRVLSTNAAGGTYTLTIAGADVRAAGNVNGPGTSTAGDLASFNNTTGTLLSDSGLVAANVNSNASNFTSGNLVSANGNHSTADSGVVVANVVTASSAYTASGDLVQAAGANKTTSDSGISAANVTQNSSSGTTNALPKFSAAHVLTNSSLSDNGTQTSSSEPHDMTTQPLVMDAANAGTTGTTVNTLAKLSSTGAVIAGTGDTAVPTYIVVSGAGTTSNAQLATSGQASCKMDATTSSTEGFFVIASTSTGGDCHAQSTAPSGAWVIGTLVSNSTTSGSNSTVAVNGYYVNTAGGGSGTVNSGSANQLAYYAFTGTAVSGETTLQAANMPALTGDVTNAAGSLATTVGKVNGASLPASASVVGTNSSGQIISQSNASVSTVALNGSTSGATTLQPQAIASGTLSLPAATDTLVGRATTDTLTNKTATTSNAGGTNSITAASEVHIPLALCTGASTSTLAWNTPPSGATAATAAGCIGTNTNDAYAAFANTGTPSLQYSLTLPQTLTGTADVYLTYSTATVSGTFTPALDAVCTATNGSATNDPAWTANNFFHPGSTTAPGTANELATLSATGISWPSDCTAGNRLHLRLIRTDTSGTATSVNVAEVVVVLRRTL